MKRSKKILDWLNKELGFSGAVLILILVIVLAYSYNKRIDLDKKQAYTTGTSLGIKKGVRGTRNLTYEFKIAGKYYDGSVPEEFCKKCLKPCCDSGSVVFVKYQYDDPENNTLLAEDPNLK